MSLHSQLLEQVIQLRQLLCRQSLTICSYDKALLNLVAVSVPGTKIHVEWQNYASTYQHLNALAICKLCSAIDTSHSIKSLSLLSTVLETLIDRYCTSKTVDS